MTNTRKTEYTCWDCGGSGNKPYYHMVDNGVCYTCKGTGKTNRFQNEASKAHTETKERKALHFKVTKQIETLEKMEREHAFEIAALFSKGEMIEANQKAEEMKKIGETLKELKQAKSELEKYTGL